MEELDFILFEIFIASSIIWVGLSLFFGWTTPPVYVTHSTIVCLFGLYNLLTNPETETTVLREAYLSALTAGYFAVDLFSTLRRGSYAYALHHVVALGLIYGAATTESFLQVKCTSTVLLTELSTPFLWISTKYKNKVTLGIFLLVFFFCRLVLLTASLYLVLYDPNYLPIPIGPFHAILILLTILNYAYFATALPKLFRPTIKQD